MASDDAAKNVVKESVSDVSHPRDVKECYRPENGGYSISQCLRENTEDGVPENGKAENDPFFFAFAWESFLWAMACEDGTVCSSGARQISHWQKTNFEPVRCAELSDKARGALREVAEPTWLRWQWKPNTWGSVPIKPVNLHAHNTVWSQWGEPVRVETRWNEKASGIIQKFRGSPELQADYTDCSDVKPLCRLAFRHAEWGDIGPPTDPRCPGGCKAPIVVRLAWVKRKSGATPEDDASFISETRDGEVYWLVAAHFAAKTRTTGDLWLWATFEHIGLLDSWGRGASPLFRDPSCSESDCPSNLCVPYDATTLRAARGTQLKRLPRDVPDSLRAVNERFREPGGMARDVRRYYQLIGVQRPYDPGSAAIPHPETLANVIFEWDHQNTSCMGCHSHSVTHTRLLAGAGSAVKVGWSSAAASGFGGEYGSYEKFLAAPRKRPTSDMLWIYSKDTK